jgi:hypothetical protein
MSLKHNITVFASAVDYEIILSDFKKIRNINMGYKYLEIYLTTPVGGHSYNPQEV